MLQWCLERGSKCFGRPKVILLTAQVLCEKGKLEEAESYALQMLHFFETEIPFYKTYIYATLADIYANMGRHDESLDYDSKLLDITKDTPVGGMGCIANTMRRLAQRHAEEGDFQEAIDLLEQVKFGMKHFWRRARPCQPLVILRLISKACAL